MKWNHRLPLLIVAAIVLTGAVAALFVFSTAGSPGGKDIATLNAAMDDLLKRSAAPSQAPPPQASPKAVVEPASTETSPAAAAEASTPAPTLMPADTSGASASNSGPTNDGKLDLNLATVAELEGLPGIGPSKAEAIAAYRKAKGRFNAVDELLNVKGIGPKMFEKLKPLVFVGK